MSELRSRGKIIAILEMQSGTSKAGKDWKKQDFVIQTEGEYPDNQCFTLFGDKIQKIASMEVGDVVEVLFNVSSREWKSPQTGEIRYFHNLNAYGVDPVVNDGGNQELPPPNYADMTGGDDSDGLPF